MNTDTKQVPRAGDFAIAAVAKGAAYAESQGTNDYVEMIARKVGGLTRIAEEDLTDTVTGERTLEVKRARAASNMAKFYDNACLGTSAAGNGTTVLYTSLYKALTTTDSSTSYTANDNRKTLSAANLTSGGTAAFSPFNDTLGIYEDSDFYDEAGTLVIASPVFKKIIRGVLDTTGRPLWDEANQTFLGYQIAWSKGARVSAVNTYSPSGNPLLFVGNRELLIKGVAKLSPNIATGNPGFALQRASTGVGFTTDEALLKAAMRRGFVVGSPQGFAVLEYTG
jgi:hypothetical protein